MRVRIGFRTLAIGAMLFGASVHASVRPAIKASDKTTINAEAAETAEEKPKNSLRSPRALRSNVVFLQTGAPQAAVIQAGGTMFRERCADCHGAEAKGDRGPDLTRLWTSETADARAFQIIRRGRARKSLAAS